MITHAAQPYARLWVRRYGFTITENRPATKFEGYDAELIELERIAPPAADAVTPSTLPRVIHRIEGAWHRPTRLEQSE